MRRAVGYSGHSPRHTICLGANTNYPYSAPPALPMDPDPFCLRNPAHLFRQAMIHLAGKSGTPPNVAVGVGPHIVEVQLEHARVGSVVPAAAPDRDA